ncbi:MAG: 30S ribosomal protein S4 [archaeon]
MTWIRKKKRFNRPKKMFDKARIETEDGLVKKYGLKSKREIWKAESAVGKVRRQAKELITASTEDQEKLYKKLGKIGIKADKISDVLGLDKEDWLKRRLQSVISEKRLAPTPNAARQLIVHKNVTINGSVVNIPSYIVKVEEESKIQVLKQIKTKEKKDVTKKQE